MTYETSLGETKAVNVKEVPAPVSLTGEWNVSFPAQPGAPENTTFDELSSWSTSSEQGIRFFSGTATYQKQFTLPKQVINPSTSLELDLGDVRVMAEVIVNGENCGVLWKAPFRVKLDGFVNEGANTLEVKVTNLWQNRLIGDAHLPNDVKRKGRGVKKWPDWLLKGTNRSSGRVSFPAYQHWSKDSPLQTAGLLGPVIIRPYTRIKLVN
jgi:hypothetical protein